MEEKKIQATEAMATEEQDSAQAEAPKTRDDMQKIFREKMEEVRKKAQEAQEAMSQGKGVLHLETPIQSGDETITELRYNFMALTGTEYTDAMDSDANALGRGNGNIITYRQALALFAKAAAKQTERLDMQDILQKIGVTDAVEGGQLATLFFNATTRAGRLRISKM